MAEYRYDGGLNDHRHRGDAETCCDVETAFPLRNVLNERAALSMAEEIAMEGGEENEEMGMGRMMGGTYPETGPRG